MRRRLLAILAILSLPLLVGSAGLWIRGYWRGDVFRVLEMRVWMIELSCERGRMIGWATDMWGGAPVWYSFDAQQGGVDVEQDPGQCEVSVRALGFALQKFSAGTMHVRNIVVAVPFWFLVSCGLIGPAWWMVSRRYGPAARRRAGRCGTCDYDLRASANRCPECGTPIPETGTPARAARDGQTD